MTILSANKEEIKLQIWDMYHDFYLRQQGMSLRNEHISIALVQLRSDQKRISFCYYCRRNTFYVGLNGCGYLKRRISRLQLILAPIGCLITRFHGLQDSEQPLFRLFQLLHVYSFGLESLPNYGSFFIKEAKYLTSQRVLTYQH